MQIFVFDSVQPRIFKWGGSPNWQHGQFENLISNIFYLPKRSHSIKRFFSSMTTECKWGVFLNLPPPVLALTNHREFVSIHKKVSSTFLKTQKETDFPWMLRHILSDFLVDGDNKIHILGLFSMIYYLTFSGLSMMHV